MRFHHRAGMRCDGYYEDDKSLRACDTDHPGWVHAKTIREIADAMAATGELVDVDGDAITGMNADGKGSVDITYRDEDGDEYSYLLYEGSHNGPGDGPDCILIPIQPPTEEELAQVYASIAESASATRETPHDAEPHT